MLPIFKKELKNYFYTPSGYIFIGLFTAVVSFMFYGNIFSMHYINFEYVLLSSLIILTFITPILTMGMFSKERKSGTLKLLITSPKSITSIVLGKFFSAVFVILVSTVVFFAYFIILKFFGDPSLVVALVAALGYIMIAMSYISLGMFVSSLFENQLVSAIITIAIFFGLSFISPTSNISFISLLNMYQKFPLGIISLNEVVGYLSFTILFILLTIIVLHKKKVN